MMHTSGTTGVPKQIPVREAALARRGETIGALLGLEEGARFVIAGLFHHFAGLGNIAAALANDTAMVLYPTFSVPTWRALEAVGPTHAITVPSIIEMLLAADALKLPSLCVLGYGGSPIHPDTMRRIHEAMPDVDLAQLFGQTEGSPLTVLAADDHRAAIAGHEELLRSVGRAASGVELHIHQPDREGIGEVWARCGHSILVDADAGSTPEISAAWTTVISTSPGVWATRSFAAGKTFSDRGGTGLGVPSRDCRRSGDRRPRPAAW
jgi:acyl-coenzyme A synthetase/AMP-(fatty) acid ligase